MLRRLTVGCEQAQEVVREHRLGRRADADLERSLPPHGDRNDRRAAADSHHVCGAVIARPIGMGGDSMNRSFGLGAVRLVFGLPDAMLLQTLNVILLAGLVSAASASAARAEDVQVLVTYENPEVILAGCGSPFGIADLPSRVRARFVFPSSELPAPGGEPGFPTVTDASPRITTIRRRDRSSSRCKIPTVTASTISSTSVRWYPMRIKPTPKATAWATPATIANARRTPVSRIATTTAPGIPAICCRRFLSDFA